MLRIKFIFILNLFSIFFFSLHICNSVSFWWVHLLIDVNVNMRLSCCRHFYMIEHFSFPFVCGSPCWWCKSSPNRRRVARVDNTFRIRSLVATSSPSTLMSCVLITSPVHKKKIRRILGKIQNLKKKWKKIQNRKNTRSSVFY